MTNTGTRLHTRTSFVTSKALKNFLSASILTSVAAQLATTTDAVIVSHMIGPNAISAINMVMPLTMFFSCFSILLGLGASVLAAKAIGEHNKEKISRIFTLSLMLLTLSGAAISVISFSYSEEIVALICPDEEIFPFALSYTRMISIGALCLILSNGINYFVSTDGSPGLVAKGVVAGAVANVILDIIFVHYIGIAGSAIATVLNYVITLAIVSTHFFKKSSSYSIVSPFKKFWSSLSKNIYEGLPLMLGNLFLGGAVFIINKMILDAAGADGIYIWSVCLQVLMITFVVLNGVGNAMLSIGGALVGGKDYNGLRILTRLSIKLVCCILALFVIFVLLFPGVLSFMFGAEGNDNVAGINNSLRIFSLLLIPFAVTLVMRFLFQILEHRILSLLLSVGQLLFIILCLWAFIKATPSNLWWSFPFSAVMLIIIQLAATMGMHLKNRSISSITLIPKECGKEPSIDFSVPYNNNEITLTIDKVAEYLSTNNVATERIDRFRYCSNRIIEFLSNNVNKKKHFFDMHVRILKDEIHIVLRDAGKRIDTSRLSLDNIEYKYMYGLNVFFAKI